MANCFPREHDRFSEEQSNGTDLVIGQPNRPGFDFGVAGGMTEQTVTFLPKNLQHCIAF